VVHDFPKHDASAEKAEGGEGEWEWMSVGPRRCITLYNAVCRRITLYNAV